MEDMFKKATQLKIRFQTPRGFITVEDLWDLPLLPQKPGGLNLDDVAKGLHRELQQDDGQSFVLEVSKPNEALQLKFELVKCVISEKLEMQKAARLAGVARERKQQILAILADKETEALKGKSYDDLKALLESL